MHGVYVLPAGKWVPASIAAVAGFLAGATTMITVQILTLASALNMFF
jgi:hypothetical protein